MITLDTCFIIKCYKKQHSLSLKRLKQIHQDVSIFSVSFSIIILFIFLLRPLPIFANDLQGTRIIQQALEEEMDRSLNDLKLDIFGPPYFLSYQVKDYQKVKINATYGAILKSDSNRFRNLFVEARVGDYKSDSAPTDLAHSGSANYVPLPVENDLGALKRAIWLATDRIYKVTALNYLRKKGRNIQRVDLEHIDDFTGGEKNIYAETVNENDTFSEHIPQWQNLVRKASALFKGQKEIISSRVDFSAQKTIRIYLNSEKTEIVDQSTMFGITISARSKSEDGMDLFDRNTISFKNLNDFPSEKLLREKVFALIQSLTQLKQSKVIEPYVGPVILEPDAAGVLFHEAIGHRLEGERLRSEREGKTFKEKIDKLILPDFINIFDDPTEKRFNDTDMYGAYHYDDEGQKAQKVVLVENGILKNFLMSRVPIKNISKSNGHGRSDGMRDPIARMGNLIVKSNNEVSQEKLKEMLLEESKKQNKPYGLIIKKITGGETNTSRYNFQVFKGTPVYIYKVYVEDGREEMVRGAEFVGTPLASINKIMATGNDYKVFNGFCGAESGYVPVSSVAPSVLLSEIEFQRKASIKSKPPILRPPDMQE